MPITWNQVAQVGTKIVLAKIMPKIAMQKSCQKSAPILSQIAANVYTHNGILTNGAQKPII